MPGAAGKGGTERHPENIGAMSMHKLATVIVRNTDSLLMSSFIGLATVGLYSITGWYSTR